MSADTINITGKGCLGQQGRSRCATRCAPSTPWRSTPSSSGTWPAGPPTRCRQWVDASVVNAGDGTHEHPTQALLDAYTMEQRLGDLDGARVAIVGDLTHSRVFRSNAITLRTLGAHVTLVAPPTLMPSGIGAWAAADGLDAHRRPRRRARLRPGRRDDAARPARADERRLLPDRARVHRGFGLTRERLRALADANPEAVICHPGPMNRGLEISADAADAAQSLVLDQVSAGVAVRMSVLYHLLAGEGAAA